MFFIYNKLLVFVSCVKIPNIFLQMPSGVSTFQRFKRFRGGYVFVSNPYILYITN